MAAKQARGSGAASELEPLRSGWRWVLAAGALTAAGAHGPVIGPHLEQAPYLGVLFVLLTGACLFLAAAAVSRDDTIVYGLSILTCGAAIVGYVATRLFAFPQLADDVGQWLEPLGVASSLAEAAVVFAAVNALRRPSAVDAVTPGAQPLRLSRTASSTSACSERSATFPPSRVWT